MPQFYNLQYTPDPLRGMQFPPAMLFDNFGPLILGHQALHLEQQIIFRAATSLPVEEHHLDAHPLQCIDA
jgi:hypothetical protein